MSDVATASATLVVAATAEPAETELAAVGDRKHRVKYM